MPAANDLHQLMELQKKDSGLDMLRARLKAIPAALKNLQDAISGEKTALDAHRENQKKLALRRKDLELELRECEEQTRKHQSELNQVKANDAFKALLTEIEEGKKRAGELETAILSAMEALDSTASEEKKLAADFAAFEKDFKTKADSLNTEKQGLESALQSGQEERDAFASGLDSSLTEKYEHIRRQRGVAVCSIRDQGGNFACSGCNMTLRPQAVVAARKKDALTQCDSCQRILFAPETK